MKDLIIPFRPDMTRRVRILALAALLLAANASAQTIIVNPYARPGLDLGGDWATIVDPYENGYYSYRYTELENGYFRDRKPASPRELVEYDFDTSDRLHVPGDWNSQSERLFFYEGTVWYRTVFDYVPIAGLRTFVHVGAANYDAVVYINGEKIGRHTGGYTPFDFEATSHVKEGRNSLVIKVDNRRTRAGVPTVNTDWWNYGGLTRDVRIIDVPDTFIRDYVVQLDTKNPDLVSVSVELDGTPSGLNVRVSLPEYAIVHDMVTGANGKATGTFSAKGIERWRPESPRLTTVVVEAGADRVEERIGFRTIETRGPSILLNGEPVYLRGISLHEVAPLRDGRATTDEDAAILLGWAKELGCNFVRLAHYPHSERMTRMADSLGLMLWAEIPVYWTILWENPATYTLAQQQLREMIVRDRNRASVVIWSVANETPRGEARLRFLSDLISDARGLDPTRLISAATELSYDGTTLVVDDPLGERLDVLGVNEYMGWYSGLPEDIPSHHWETPFDKPVVISEFGAGAKAGLHGDPQHRWTEEYQAEVYRGQIEMLSRVPFIQGMTPWILTDFRSPRRPLPDIQDFWNRKGLISEHGEKKMAFYVLRDFYRARAAE